MHIELGMKIQLEIQGMESRLNSVLVGAELNKYIIIKTPTDATYDEIVYKLFPGNEVFVRYLYSGTVFGLKSKLIEAIVNPEKLLFIEYPKKIEIHNLRTYERLACFLPAKVQTKDEERHGAILDINEKGCRFIFNYKDEQSFLPVHQGTQITMLCQFPGIAEEQKILGKVRNINEGKKQTFLGIEFDQIDTKVHDIIMQYISAAKEFI